MPKAVQDFPKRWLGAESWQTSEVCVLAIQIGRWRDKSFMYFLPFACSLVSIPSQFPCSHLFFLGVFEQLERRVLLRSASPRDEITCLSAQQRFASLSLHRVSQHCHLPNNPFSRSSIYPHSCDDNRHRRQRPRQEIKRRKTCTCFYCFFDYTLVWMP